MKITEKLLSIPPYISTSWENIQALSIGKNTNASLIIELKSTGATIEIPDLPMSVIEAVFDMHAKFLEEEVSATPAPAAKQEEFPIPPGFPPFKIGSVGIGGLDQIGNAMQHNPEQMNAPDLPPEVLKKITSIAKALGIDDPHNLPKPEPHCNCMHCQIAKALQVNSGTVEENLDEEVSEEELKFRTWDIEQIGENLYTVTNPLEEKEKYNVFLGKPIGCTCGEQNCEHIQAVLKS